MRKILITCALLICAISVYARDWFVPTCNSKSHLHEYHEYEGMQLCYEEDYEQPMFVSYHVTREQLGTGRKRTNTFTEDFSISTGSAADSDYSRSGYSRGHLAPNGDLNYSETTQKNSFLMSNISPQLQTFNGGIWVTIEEYVREKGKVNDDTYVITGPILKKGLPTIGANKVAVPEEFFKVAVFVNDGFITDMDAFIASQDTTKKTPLADLRVSIQEIEKRTSLVFFPSLDDSFKKKPTLSAPVSLSRASSVKASLKDTIAAYKALTPSEAEFLRTKVASGMLIKNIAREMKKSLNEVYYFIGYYGLYEKHQYFKENKSKRITYKKLADTDILLEYVGVVSSIDELAADYNTTNENALINIGSVTAGR